MGNGRCIYNKEANKILEGISIYTLTLFYYFSSSLRPPPPEETKVKNPHSLKINSFFPKAILSGDKGRETTQKS